MALRRWEKKTNASNSTLRRAQPRAVAVAARKKFFEHTQRRADADFPGSPATQDPAGDLSAPIPQRNSEPAVMSAIDVPVISALSALPASAVIPASAAIPDSSATPASAENPIPRSMAPPQQYVQTGERAPKSHRK